MEDTAEIPKFYAHKSVLITGSTGFIGKVLIWKLLHSCPLIERIYILMRPKHGKDIAARFKELCSLTFFEDLRKGNPGILEKLVPIVGDIGAPDLGISNENRSLLINEVSIIFHNAAVLKMDASLKDAINVNTIGMIRILDIAKEMKQLLAIVYVSTAYSCCNETEVEEKLYFIKENPRDIIKSVEWLPNKIVEKITADLINPLPNTYTFSKRLTELLLVEYESTLPIIIARPTIVICAWKEPVPGYIDNLNGAGGIAVTTGKGLLHSMPAHADKNGDLVPVDVVCNSLIAIPWAELKKQNTFSKIPVYNLAVTEQQPLTWRQFQICCEVAARKYPYEVILWYPSYDVIQENYFLHRLSVIFYHMIPAYIIDFIMLLIGKKRFMVRIQTKINQGLKVLRYFSTQQWTFRTDNILKLKEMMNERDREIFPVTEKGLNFKEMAFEAAYASKKYMFKENIDDMAKCKRKLKILYGVKIITKIVIYYIFVKIVWSLLNAIVTVGIK